MISQREIQHNQQEQYTDAVHNREFVCILGSEAAHSLGMIYFFHFFKKDLVTTQAFAGTLNYEVDELV